MTTKKKKMKRRFPRRCLRTHSPWSWVSRQSLQPSVINKKNQRQAQEEEKKGRKRRRAERSVSSIFCRLCLSVFCLVFVKRKNTEQQKTNKKQKTGKRKRKEEDVKEGEGSVSTFDDPHFKSVCVMVRNPRTSRRVNRERGVGCGPSRRRVDGIHVNGVDDGSAPELLLTRGS